VQSALLQGEIDRLAQKGGVYGPDVVWKQNEYSEILPFPRPLSLSVLRSLASCQGAAGMGCRELGLPYNASVPVDDYLETVFGRTLVNSAAEKILTRAGASFFFKKLAAAVKLQKEVLSFYRRFDEITGAFNDFSARSGELDLASLTEPELLAEIELRVRTLNAHYRYVVQAGLFAKFSLDDLTARFGEDQLAALLAVDSQALASSDPAALDIFAFRKNSLAAFAVYGADVDYELSGPRFIEKKQAVPQIASRRRKGTDPAGIDRKAKTPLLQFKIYESLKIIFKTMLLKELYGLRLALLEYQQRLNWTGGLFFLQLEEILSGEARGLTDVINHRKALRNAFRRIEVPSAVTPADLHTLGVGPKKAQTHPLKGISVNGEAFSGRAVICAGNRDFRRADRSRILVSKQAGPDLVVAFGIAGGIIAETGGQLSHLSIVAREQGFPLVIQARDAMALIQEGDFLSVDKNGSITINQQGG